MSKELDQEVNKIIIQDQVISIMEDESMVPKRRAVGGLSQNHLYFVMFELVYDLPDDCVLVLQFNANLPDNRHNTLCTLKKDEYIIYTDYLNLPKKLLDRGCLYTGDVDDDIDRAIDILNRYKEKKQVTKIKEIC